MERICGFMVVRKPEHAQEGSVKPNMRIGEAVYRGIDRLPWEELDGAFWERHLPFDLENIRAELERENSDFSGLRLLRDYNKTKMVLNFSGEKSEIVAVSSPEIEIIKGVVYSEARMKFLGFDCFALGAWSVLQAGVYQRSEHFQETIPLLNEHGLLKSAGECDKVFERYLELASHNFVEPLMRQVEVVNIAVYAVNGAGIMGGQRRRG